MQSYRTTKHLVQNNYRPINVKAKVCRRHAKTSALGRSLTMKEELESTFSCIRIHCNDSSNFYNFAFCNISQQTTPVNWRIIFRPNRRLVGRPIHFKLVKMVSSVFEFRVRVSSSTPPPHPPPVFKPDWPRWFVTHQSADDILNFQSDISHSADL